MKAIILAGGSGQRFWPLSDPGTPKQFLKLLEDRSLIRTTYDRIRSHFQPSDIYVITNVDQISMTKEHLPELPERNIIGEPEGKNTAPACILGTLAIGDEENQLVVPADHHISDPDSFWRSFEVGKKALETGDYLITFGIKPSRPETGYGYVEKGERIDGSLYKVNSFREKPDRKTAVEFIKSGRFFWNSGMFMWKGSTLISELERYNEKLLKSLKGIDWTSKEQLKKAYSSLEKISIDNAVMENSDKVMMVEGDFPWNDLGSWLSIKELNGYSEEDENTLLHGSEDVFVHGNFRPVAVMGLRGVIVVDSPNGLLIMSEEMSQEVRRAYLKFA